MQEAEGQTALHTAAAEGDEAMVKFLYSVRADANVSDFVSLCLHPRLRLLFLFTFIVICMPVLVFVFVFLLLLVLVFVFVCVCVCVCVRVRVLSFACLFCPRDSFTFPLMFQNDRTPLHLAAQRGHSNIAEFLVDKFKANVNLRTKVS